jgi:hypothetical protein
MQTQDRWTLALNYRMERMGRLRHGIRRSGIHGQAGSRKKVDNALAIRGIRR